MADKKYAVFLSFNREDRKMVEQIAVYLQDKVNLRPWFDEWDLIPGERWVRKLESGLAESATCAVFVGKSGEGPWQAYEVEDALRQQVNNKDFRVIPVLLPDAPQQLKLPPFLAGSMWVDFRGKQLDDTETLRRLECGIRGVTPGPGSGSPLLEECRKPPFERPSADFLMDFKAECTAFQDIVTGTDSTTRLLLIHGPNGGEGKSTLLKEYLWMAYDQNLRAILIELKKQSAVEDCLDEMVACFGGIKRFPRWNQFLLSGRPEPFSRMKEAEWLKNLIRRFFEDLGDFPLTPRLVILIDQYEKADFELQEWFNHAFLPYLYSLPLLVVIAGRDEIEKKPSWKEYHSFRLAGVSVKDYRDYVTYRKFSISDESLELLYKVTKGVPKFLVEFVQGELGHQEERV
jgi:hypothetical protein